jgi:putative chitinase
VLAQAYGPALEKAMAEFKITGKNPSAMFIAQVLHESSRLTAVRENLNYSELGLITTFKKYFDRNIAKRYARQPEKIANRVYANRMGNGNENSGDGWKYRGRGLIQLTGKDNYTDCGRALGKDLIKDPGYLETTEGAARSAAWFWHSRGLNKSANAGDIKSNTRIINGGLKGYDDRVNLYNKAVALF